MENFKLFLMVVGMVMIVEGVPYFIAPEQVKKVAGAITKANRRFLRLVGFALMMMGLSMVAFGRF
ncbi:MAG: DUF2065 domain-containing protein [Nitrospinae bacterium]|nr:DUF2065 domain-containing protein [Nitrospinota bacterium]